ncbi:hypothetical protein HA051_16210 [Chromobacterium vaccinii]|nr:hypothetical protein [Chromobacterium vaccinii]
MISSPSNGMSVNAKFGSMALDGGAVEERAKKFNTGEASKTYDGQINILKASDKVDTAKLEGLHAQYEEIEPNNPDGILRKLRIADEMAAEGKSIRAQCEAGDSAVGDAARTVSLFPHVFLPVNFSISLKDLQTIGMDRNTASEIGLNVVGDASERRLLIVGGVTSDGSNGLAASVKTPGNTTPGFEGMNVINIVHTHPREGLAKASDVEFNADVKGQGENDPPALVRSHSGGTYLFSNEDAGGVFNEKKDSRFSPSSLSIPSFAKDTMNGGKNGFPFHRYEPKSEGVDVGPYKEAVVAEITGLVGELNDLYSKMSNDSFTADGFLTVLGQAGDVRKKLENVNDLSSVKNFEEHFKKPDEPDSGFDLFSGDFEGVNFSGSGSESGSESEGGRKTGSQ